MDQRRLRPGDRLEDYCSRERRLTDHVVVAVVGDDVKQTRCVACDAEHIFKGGRVPPRRKKEPNAVLVEQVLEGLTDDITTNGEPGAQPNLVMRPERKPAKGKRGLAVVPPSPAAVADPLSRALKPEPPAVEPEEAVADAPPAEDEGPVHRRLIRATLPRPEGQQPTRPLPEFTVRQPGLRHGFPRGGGQPFGGARVTGGRPAGPWSGQANGHGRQRPSAQAPGHAGGDARGFHKGRGRSGRPHPKKAR
jgi:hypothetical protein